MWRQILHHRPFWRQGWRQNYQLPLSKIINYIQNQGEKVDGSSLLYFKIIDNFSTRKAMRIWRYLFNSNSYQNFIANSYQNFIEQARMAPLSFNWPLMEESSMHKRKMNFTNLTTFFIISFSNSDLFIQLTFEKHNALWWRNSNDGGNQIWNWKISVSQNGRHWNSPLLWKNNSSWKPTDKIFLY